MERYAEQILALVAETDRTLEEIVSELRKRRIRTSKSSVATFFERHRITFKKKNLRARSSRPTWRGRVELAGIAFSNAAAPSTMRNSGLRSPRRMRSSRRYARRPHSRAQL